MDEPKKKFSPLEWCGDKVHKFFYSYSTDGSITRVLADAAKALAVGCRTVGYAFSAWVTNTKDENSGGDEN